MDQIDFNKLWQNFVDTITNHYADFNGRVGRAQYWYYILVCSVVGIGVAIAGSMLWMSGLLQGLFSLALFLPTVGMTARRLQDSGRPGTWAWLLAVPLGYEILIAILVMLTFITLGAGAILLIFAIPLRLLVLAAVIVLIYFCAQPGEAAANAFGPVPPVWSPAGPPPTPPAAP